jgi:hypothetical protein
MTGYADLVPLRTTAEAARELAEHTGLPADIQAAEEADAALEAALAPTVGQLDPGVPLLLLPVRIETRYRASAVGGTELLVRVYPEVDIDEHEPFLTATEVEAGQAFWTSMWTASADNERLVAWTHLVTRVGRLRAAWVWHQTTPQNQPGGGVPPVFGQPPVQAARWMRARRATLQPDRWVATAFRGDTRIAHKAGGLVTRPLPAGPDPSVDVPPGTLTDPGMLWMIDFDAALRVGQAIVLPLPDRDPIDLITVTGVRGTERPADDAAALAALLTAHRFHTGLDLLPAGVPTTNTDDARSGHGSADPTGAADLAVVTAGPRVASGDGSDAAQLAGALGIDVGPLSELAGSTRRGVSDQADLAALLWPGTWGYYVTQLLRLNDADAGTEAWRRWMVDTVRPGGPLPAIRVGDQPYGVLPVTALDRWRPRRDRGNLLTARLIDDGAGGRRTDLSALGQLDPLGTWTFWASLGSFDAPAGATDVTVAFRDRDADGRAEILLGYAGSAVGQRFVLRCELCALRGQGFDRTGTVELPPLDPPVRGTGSVPLALGLALGDLGGAHVHGPGVTDLVAVVQSLVGFRPVPRQRILVHVGLDLDRTGQVTGGWSPGLDVTAEFGSDERILAAELLDRRGEGVDLVVLSTSAPADRPPPAGSLPVTYRVARGLTRDGTITEGWSAPLRVGFPAGDAVVVGAAAAVDDDAEGPRRLFVGTYSTFTGGGFGGSYTVGTDLTDGVPATWMGFIGAEGGPEVLLGASAAFARWLPVRSPGVGLQFAAARGNLLVALRDTWRTALPGVARVRPGDPDPSRTLLDLLATGDVSSAYQVRPFVGPRVRDMIRFVTGGPAAGAGAPAWAQIEPLLFGWGLPAGRVPVLGAGGFATSAVDVADPLVADPEPGWEERRVTWLKEMVDAKPEELHNRWIEPGTPLLARLVRHSLLQAYADAALALVPVVADPPPLPEPELVDIADVTLGDPFTPDTLTSWRHLIRARLNGVPVAEFIYAAARAADPPPEVVPLAEAIKALSRLFSRTAGELTRLAAGTLDAATHRLDAWITAVATDRLRALRANTATGIHIGGYGYVRDLRPATTGPSTGYVHAPSAAHAATAGVLRSGYLTHGGDSLAVDLSSARVRLALELLDAVREGQTLGAALGYRFERDLHDTGLGQYLQAFREVAPEGVGVLTPKPPGTPAAAVAGLVTVDGLGLLRLAGEGSVPWGTTPPGQPQQLPLPGSDHHDRLAAVLSRLRDGADAIADLGVAESVHQTLQRNHLRAGGSLDALSRGELPPPEPEVVRSPRTGIGVVHRVLAVAPDPAGPVAADALAAWTSTPAQRARHARAAAEPRLNAWAALVLGDPGRVRWRAAYLDPETGQPTGRVDELSLAAVGLCPLDALAATSPDVGTLTETNLGARLRRHAAHLPAAAGRTELPELLLDRPPDWDSAVLSVPELLTLADAARSLVAAGRGATASDLSAAGVSTDRGVHADELAARASAAVTGLDSALTALRGALALDAAERAQLAVLFPATFPAAAAADTVRSLADLPLTCDVEIAVATLGRPAAADLETLRDRLETLAGFGLPGAAPADVAGTGPAAAARLAIQARACAVDGASRLIAAAEAEDDIAVLGTIFGPGFRALPVFDPGLPAGTAPADADEETVEEWFEEVARVREPSGRLADLALLAAATEGASVRWKIAQHPADGARWLALPPVPAAPGQPPARIPAGGVSIALAGFGADPATSGPQSMLAVDSWVEVVPNPTEDTAVSFHFDVPANCAPQSLLLAVHPDPDLPWDDDTLVDVVRETAMLADLRMIDPALVPVVGHLLPAVLLAQNVGGDPGGDTVSTTLRR